MLLLKVYVVVKMFFICSLFYFNFLQVFAMYFSVGLQPFQSPFGLQVRDHYGNKSHH